MVDEFSSFARMPRPDLKLEDINELVEQAVFLERNRYPDIEIVAQLPLETTPLVCDARQISQALVNVMKNAAEAIIAREQKQDVPLPAGRIGVTVAHRVEAGTDQVVVVIEDNGKGLPKENRDRLTEPYVTTRARGTGLGLAIVKKIMEDHQAELVLSDRDGGGARVMLIFRETAPSEWLSYIDAVGKRTAKAAP